MRRTSGRRIVKKSVIKSPVSSKIVKKPIKKNDLLHRKNQFLAVKNETGGFYLCRSKQEIHDNMKKFSTQWLEETKKNSKHYKLGGSDQIPVESIICHVQMKSDGKQYELKDADKKLILKELNVNDEEKTSESEDETAAKKARGNRKVVPKKEKQASRPVKRKLAGKDKKAAGSPKKKVKKPSKAKGLQPKPHIKVLLEDPLFDTREKVPRISTLADSRLVIRAVNLNDQKLLHTYINDRVNVASVIMCRCLSVHDDAVTYAIKKKNFGLLKILMDEIRGRNSSTPRPKRASLPACLLSSIETGVYNKASLSGLPYVRTLAMSRGSKEGNNAFLKDDTHVEQDYDNYQNLLFYQPLDKSTLDKFLLLLTGTNDKNYMLDNIHKAVRAGNVMLASLLVNEHIKLGSNSYNNLHQIALSTTNQKLPTGIREASIKKKPWDGKKVTPMHFAAINPNTYYISTLYSIYPDFHLIDGNGMKPIHYAATCEGVGPLQFLLTKGNLDEIDGMGRTPLMIAASLGRRDNVEAIIKEAEKSNAEVTKLGLAGINRTNMKDRGTYSGFTALHYACFFNHLECAVKLVEKGAYIEKALPASKGNLTPLMVAARKGHLDLMQALVEKGAKPEKKDKLKRTALTHACMNGHTHVVSYLLNIGCNPNQADSSGNTPLHYAAAYGWYFPVKLLLQAEADVGCVNDWKLTPMAVAYLKGHIGLANILLDESKGFIDFRLNDGNTLLMMACSSSLGNDSIAEQIRYLVEDKKADCSLVNDFNKNALHILAQNQSGKNQSMFNTVIKKVAEILLKNGCDVNAPDQDGVPPVVHAVRAGNDSLVEYLLENANKIGGLDYRSKDGTTVLHNLATACLTRDVYPVATFIIERLKKEGTLQGVLSQCDNNGYTPLLAACHTYQSWDEHVYHEEKKASYDELNMGLSEGADEDYDEKHNESQDHERSIIACKYWYQGRRFLRLMLSHMGREAFDVVVQPQKTSDTTKISYLHSNEAGYGLLDFMLTTSNEKPMRIIDKKTKEEHVEKNPGVLLALKRLHRVLSRSHNNKKVIEEKFKEYVNKHDRDGLTPLMASTLSHNHSLTQLLLKNNADVNVLSRSKYSMKKGNALMIVLRHRSYDEMPRLIDAGSLMNMTDERSQCNPLHYICMKPDYNKLLSHLETFLEAGCDSNHRDVLGQTPLHKLSKLTSSFSKVILEAMELLMGRGGCDVSIRDKEGLTALHITVSCNTGDVNSSTEYQQALTEKCPELVDIEDNKKRVPLHYVYCKINNNMKSNVDPIELTYFLTNQSSKVKRMVNQPDHLNMTPLHMAAKIGAGFCCIHLVDKGADLNAKTRLGNTPLSLAVKSGVESCVMLLMQKQANLNCEVYEGSVEKEEEEEEEENFSSEEEYYSDDYDSDDSYLAKLRKKKNYYEKKKEKTKMLENKKEIICDDDIYRNIEDANEEERKKEGTQNRVAEKKTPSLLWTPDRVVKELPVEQQHYPIIKGVILHGWQGVMFSMLEGIKNYPEISISSILKWIMETNKYNLALNLLSKTKTTAEQLNSRDSLGRTLAHHIALNSKAGHTHFTNVMRLLEERGVNFELKDDTHSTPLHYACLNINSYLVRFIVEKLKGSTCLNMKDRLGRPPIAALLWDPAVATNLSHLPLMKFLVGKGATLNFVCSFPVHKYTFLRVKKQAKCAYLQTDKLRDDVCLLRLTPLMFAVVNENVSLCKELISLHADVNTAQDNGVTAMMLALALNNHEIISVLLQSAESKWVDEFKFPSFYFDPPLTRKITDQEKEKEAAKKGNEFQLGKKVVEDEENDNDDENNDGENDEDGENDDDDQNEEDDNGENDDEQMDDDYEDVSTKNKTKTQAEIDEEQRRLSEIDDVRTSYIKNGFCMYFKPIRKTSNVNLNAHDKKGRCLLDYLIPPVDSLSTNSIKESQYAPDIDLAKLKYPVYDNHSLLLFLLSLGATFNQSDKTGVQFRERARKQGCVAILTALQYHSKQHAKMNFVNLYDDIGQPFKGNRKIDKSLVTPESDANDFLEKYEREHLSKEPKFEAVADEVLDDSMKGPVYMDDGMPCDALLFKIDAKQRYFGMYNFYKLQLIYQKNKDLSILLTRWGRIGDKGQFQQTPFGSIKEALSEFAKIFHSKTGNEWNAYKKFEEKPKKYKLVPLENRVAAIDESKIPIEMDSNVESALVPSVKELIHEMTNESALNHRLNRAGLSLVLSRVTRDQIAQAHNIIKELSEEVKTKSKLEHDNQTLTSSYETVTEKIAELSNKFHRILPKSGYEFERLQIFDSQSSLKDIKFDLDILSRLEITTRFMLAAMNKKHVMNPCDYVYSCLDCRLSALSQDHPETQTLLKYIKSSWNGKVQAIFKVNCDRDKGKFQDSKTPRKLLFHGTSPTNLISVLTRGLLVRPKEASHSGNTFGDGVYLADTFKKSVNYCRNYNYNHRNVLYMLVCEADLGNPYHLHTHYAHKFPPIPCQSMVVLGYNAPNPIYDVVLPSGAIVPQGNLVNLKSNWDKNLYNLVENNEYVVYDTKNIAIRYLVQFIS